MEQNNVYYEFNRDLSYPFNLVHPQNLKKVQKVSQFKFPEKVLKVTLFGSSLTLACDQFSDVDLFLLIDSSTTEDEEYKIYGEVGGQCQELGIKYDILLEDLETLKSQAISINNVEHEIFYRSVLLYEKE